MAGSFDKYKELPVRRGYWELCAPNPKLTIGLSPNSANIHKQAGTKTDNPICPFPEETSLFEVRHSDKDHALHSEVDTTFSGQDKHTWVSGGEQSPAGSEDPQAHRPAGPAGSHPTFTRCAGAFTFHFISEKCFSASLK